MDMTTQEVSYSFLTRNAMERRSLTLAPSMEI